MTSTTMTSLAASDPQALWFLNRATGLVLLALFTLSLVLGVLASSRRLPSWWPIFLGNELHRKVSLLSLSFLVVHIGTAVADSFVDIDLVDVFVPFRTPYRPFWMALGTLATDVLVVVLVTTALRSRMSERGWRVVHALSYLMWPFALMHGLGIGTDTHSPAVLALNTACLGLVVAAVVWRLMTADALGVGSRIAGIATTLAVTAGVAIWLMGGPLASGWSDKAGTPPPNAQGPK